MHALAELERLVRPAATRQDFLDEADWRRALALLSRAIADARGATDPDRPLPSEEWGRLVDRDAPGESLDLAELLSLQRIELGDDAPGAAADDERDDGKSTGPLHLDFLTKPRGPSRSSA